LRANAYAGASSSVVTATLAAAGRVRQVGVHHWTESLRTLRKPGNGMSEVVLEGVARRVPLLEESLFSPGTPRVLVAASRVKTEEGAKLTQGRGARSLGRRLLVQAARGDAVWAEEHLEPVLFDTAAEAGPRLWVGNLAEVGYATTRMLHAWRVPAWVGGEPYVDASFTRACPAAELARMGYGEVVAVANESGPLWRDIFRTGEVPEAWEGAPIRQVKPAMDPKDLGVDFAGATEEGLLEVYRRGEEEGRAFLAILKA